MAKHGRWDTLNRALSEFITVLPQETELSIITFAKNAIMHLPPTTVTEFNRHGLHGRLPKRTFSISSKAADNTCFLCAFNVTFKALQDQRGQMQPSTVIFVTGSNPSENLDLVATIFANEQIQFFSMAFGSSPELLKLSRPHGRHFALMDWSQSQLYAFASMSQVFYEILSSVEHRSFATVHIQLHDEQGPVVSGNFVMENTMRAGLVVSLLVDNTDKIEFFELHSPSGEKKLFPTYMDGYIFFQLDDGIEPGVWTYKVDTYTDLPEPPQILIKALAIQSDSKYGCFSWLCEN